MIERLIICQGTAQLVTAVNALRKHVERTKVDSEQPESREHLLICGLAVSAQQELEFVRTIERIASLLHPFATISRLSDGVIERMYVCAQHTSGALDIAGMFYKAIGMNHFDEVFIVRDWQACNVLVLSAFPDAMHVCYGDSVGVYFPKNFMLGKSTFFSSIASWSSKLRMSRSSLLLNSRLDVSYLLLPEAFGSPPSGQVVSTEPANLLDIFNSLSSLLDKNLLNDLREQIKGRFVWVLMGSNFSEQGMMSIGAEVDAYYDWIKGLNPDPNIVLLIKAHPRDRAGKHELLEQRLQNLFNDIFSVNEIGSPYLPVEVLLLNLIPFARNLECLTVSTACLATRLVLGINTYIGFGDELVTKYVVSSRQLERCQHESDLRRLCADFQE